MINRISLISLILLLLFSNAIADDQYDCKPRNNDSVILTRIFRKVYNAQEDKHTLEEIEEGRQTMVPKWQRDHGADYFERVRDAQQSGKPEQVHLSLTQEPSEMVVTWVTFKKMAMAPTVRYRRDDNSGPQLNATGSTHTYNITYVGWNGWIHVATMNGLDSGAAYRYEVSGATADVWSPSFVFKTRQAEPNPFTMVAFGDMGTFPGGGVFGPITTKHLERRIDDYEFVLDIGDIAYAMEYQPFWDQLFNQIEPVAAVKPWMAAVGNHESPYNFTAYSNRFTLPHDGSGSDTLMWYSFDYQLVHFVALSSEHPHSEGTPQHAWMLNDLAKASANRDRVPWIVVVFHKPMYCSNTFVSCHGWASGARSAFEDAFYANHVNLVLFGHVHAFEITHPVYNCAIKGTVEAPKAPIYSLVGMAGAIGYGRYWHDPQPEWSLFRDGEHFGFSELHFNRTHLTFELFVDAEAGPYEKAYKRWEIGYW